MKKTNTLILGLALLPFSSGAQNSSSIDLKNLFGDLRARHIGPALMSGRINDMKFTLLIIKLFTLEQLVEVYGNRMMPVLLLTQYLMIIAIHWSCSY